MSSPPPLFEKEPDYLAKDDAIFTVSILQARQRGVAEIFGGPHREQRPTPALTLVDTVNPIVPDAGAWFVCHKQQSIEAGDHTIIVSGVDDFGERDGPPLVFYCGGYFSELRDESEDSFEFLLLER